MLADDRLRKIIISPPVVVCQDVERDTDPNGNGMRMARIVWIYYMSKFVELLDTIFFLARKKFSHISKLQVIKQIGRLIIEILLQ